jgi:PAS domain-containing protein
MADEAGTGAQNGWRHFRLAERAARFGYWRLNLADSKMFWSDGLYRLLGLEPGSVEPTTDHLGDTMLADEIEMVREAFEMSIRGRKPFYCRTHAKDTDRLAQVVDTHGEVEMDETGRVIALVGVCRDMTAQVTAEKKNANSRKPATARWPKRPPTSSCCTRTARLRLHQARSSVCSSGLRKT